MSNEEKKKRADYKRIRASWIVFQSIALILLALFTAYISATFYQKAQVYYIDYTETSEVDYRVYLKENDFYEEEYLNDGQAYVASLIDHVEAEFEYKVDMDNEKVNYNYQYTIEAIVVVEDASMNMPLYNPSFELKSSGMQYSENDNLKIKEKVNIDYNYYNQLANNYVEGLRLSNVVSYLTVKTHIQVISVCEEFVEQDAKNEYIIELNMPLSKQTISINFSSSIPTAETKILACEPTAEDKDIYFSYSVGFVAFDLVLLLILIIYIFATRNDDINYTIKVKKLVNNYRSYIQKILNRFDTTGYQVLKLSTFNEMLDVRDTIQSPILMHENEDQTITRFYIPTNTKIVYTFEIRVEGYVDPEELPVVGPLEEAIEEVNKVEESVVETPVVEEVVISPVEEVVEVKEEPVVEEVVETKEELIEETPVVEMTEEVVEEVIDEAEGEVVLLVDEADEIEESTEEVVKEDAMAGFSGPRYNYSFEAKLSLSNDETKSFYNNIATFAKSYGVKVVRSWKKERIYKGRKVFGIMFFKGKRLCVAMPLDPKEYEGSKYKFTDLSEVKKYQETPFLMKVTSSLKVRYINELLEKQFVAAEIKNKNLEVASEEIPSRTKEELIEAGLVRVTNKEKETV